MNKKKKKEINTKLYRPSAIHKGYYSPTPYFYRVKHYVANNVEAMVKKYPNKTPLEIIELEA